MSVPHIDSAPDAYGQENRGGDGALYYKIHALPDKGTTYDYSGTLPDGIAYDAGSNSFRGTPATGTAGDYTINVTATNPDGSDDLDVVIHILPPGVPWFSGPPGISGEVDQPLFPVDFAWDGSPTAYTIELPLPDGLSFDTGTGILTGTPTVAQEHQFYHVSATNGTGTGTNILSIEVVGDGVPVIFSPPSLDVVVNAPVTYQIRATERPTSFAATGLPPNLSVSSTTGRIQGKVKTAGVYHAIIQATNDAGTGQAPLVITATDGGGGGGEGVGVTVYPAKVWQDPDEVLDYADLDAAGQPLCAIDPGAIGAAQLKPDAIATKVGWVGGPGALYNYTLPADLLIVNSLVTVTLGIVPTPGSKAGDVVIPGRLMNLDGTSFGTDKRLYLFGQAQANQTILRLTNFGEASPTIPKDTFVNFRLFRFQ